MFCGVFGYCLYAFVFKKELSLDYDQSLLVRFVGSEKSRLVWLKVSTTVLNTVRKFAVLSRTCFPYSIHEACEFA